jgi:2-succinyl-6-hydroxy-2,4-cyclohexadiene-1-carboxylate synthase
MGGRIALYLTVNHPAMVRSLILESASPGIVDDASRAERRTRDNALAARIEQGGVEAFVDYWEALPLWVSQQWLSEEKRAALRAQRLENSAVGLANSLRGMGTGVQPSLWDKLPKIDLPTLLIAGALDEKFVGINQQMAEQMPQAQLEVIENVGHTVHLEKPETYVETVLAFLDGAAS